MALSNKTKIAITSVAVKDTEFYYPDVSATTGETRDTDATTSRLQDVPRTTEDMSNAEKWQHGQKVYGTHAKNDQFWKDYRKDITKARKAEYKNYYVDTLRPVKPQLQDKRTR